MTYCPLIIHGTACIFPLKIKYEDDNNNSNNNNDNNDDDDDDDNTWS